MVPLFSHYREITPSNVIRVPFLPKLRASISILSLLVPLLTFLHGNPYSLRFCETSPPPESYPFKPQPFSSQSFQSPLVLAVSFRNVPLVSFNYHIQNTKIKNGSKNLFSSCLLVSWLHISNSPKDISTSFTISHWSTFLSIYIVVFLSKASRAT